jgi:hypothetical protein
MTRTIAPGPAQRADDAVRIGAFDAVLTGDQVRAFVHDASVMHPRRHRLSLSRLLREAVAPVRQLPLG